MSDYVVYRHYHVIGGDELTFYVGMGNPRRPFTFNNRSQIWNRHVVQHGDPQVEVIHCGLSKGEAHAIEIETIAKYKRACDGGTLLNVSIGGPGQNGVIPRKESRDKLAAANLGQKRSEESRARMSAVFSGVPKSPEHRAKLAAVNLGKKYSAETNAKKGEHARGLKRSPETCAKIAAKLRGRQLSKEHGAKIGEANRRRLVSSGQRAKVSVAVRAYWASKRLSA